MPEVGQWGPEIFVDRRGRPTPLVTVTVYETDGVTPATLYADQAGVAVLANPLPVGVASTAAGLDDQANGSFYAPPGPYVMSVRRAGVEVYRSPVTVGVDTPGAGGAPSGAAGGDLGGSYPNPTLSAAKQAELDADEAALAAHLIDATDAHDASAISFAPDGSIAATNVQAAIVEVRDEAGGGGAPTTADYLVGTAQGGLSAEIVVGAAPGGELGGTWGSPTVDASHSGSTHAAAQAAAEATAAAALALHEADTTAVHGITDTAALETTSGSQAKVDAHVNDASDAHDASAISILDTANDFAATDVEGALAELQSDHEADVTALSDHVADASAAHAAAAISFAPDGSIAATTVQAAIVEVRDEAAGGGAPSTADFLVGTAQGGLSAEIVVGATPGGELGGTWASPTVDATHSGSTHAAVQAAAEATAAADATAKVAAEVTARDAAIEAHRADTSNVHGFVDAAAVETKVGHLTVTQAVDLDAIETRVNSLDAAVVLRGNWDASAGTFPGGGTAQAGDSYIVTVGGTVNAVVFAVGDRIVAITDNASTGTYAANWLKLDYTDAVLSVDGRVGAVTLGDLYAAASEPIAAAHIIDGTAAHAAAAVAFTPAGTIAGTDVQTAVAEVATDAATALSTHEADTTSVHGIADTSALETTSGAQAKVDAHINDASDAHDASAISILDTAADFTATDVEGALAELQTDHEADATALSDHIADAADAHAATAITNTPAGTIAATTVQGALNELDTDKATTGSVSTVATDLSNHLADTADAHDASAVSILDTANDFAATDVEGALAELQTDHEADATALSDHVADTSAAHAASAISILDTAGDFTATEVEGALAELQTFDESLASLVDGENTTVDATAPFLKVNVDSLVIARLMTTAALPACTYYNGAGGDGVGATLTGDAVGVLADIDSTGPVAGDRVIVNNQASQLQNGIYDVTALGSGGAAFVLTRAPLADQTADYAAGIFALVISGTSYRGSIQVASPTSVTMGTTSITWRGVSRPNATPADISLGSSRDRRRYSSDFEELSTAITATSTLVPGTTFVVLLSGTGATATQQQAADSLPGVIDLATGTTTTGFCNVVASVTAFTFDATKRFRFYARAKTPTASSAAELFNVLIGASNGMNAGLPQTDGVYFEQLNDGGNWDAVTQKAQATEASQAWTRATTVVTVTTTAHGMVVGDTVVISATSDAAALPNGTYTVVTVPLSSTYTITGLNAGATSGTATTARSLTTRTDTGVAPTTFHKQFLIRCDDSSITFYIAGLLVATHTTNLPVVGLFSGARILKQGGSTGTTSRSLRVDRMDVDCIDSRTLSPTIP